MRDRNLLVGMLAAQRAAFTAAVWEHSELREEADRKSAFCVPAKQEHRRPPRRDTHMMETSFLPDPHRSTMARDDDVLSPTILAVTGTTRWRTTSDRGKPHARREHGMSASWM